MHLVGWRIPDPALLGAHRSPPRHQLGPPLRPRLLTTPSLGRRVALSRSVEWRPALTLCLSRNNRWVTCTHLEPLARRPLAQGSRGRQQITPTSVKVPMHSSKMQSCPKSLRLAITQWQLSRNLRHTRLHLNRTCRSLRTKPTLLPALLGAHRSPPRYQLGLPLRPRQLATPSLGRRPALSRSVG